MSDIRNMVADSINRLFAESIDTRLLERFEEGYWPFDLWKLVEDGDFPKVLLAEEAGGTGGGWTDALPVLHAVGYYRVPLPLVETVVGNWLLAQSGMPIGDGACSVLQQIPGDSLRMQLEDGLALSGYATSVPWARFTKHLVVAGTAEGRPLIGIVRLDAPGVRITPATNSACEPRDRVDFDRCLCLAYARQSEALADEPVLVYGALARSVAMVGALESVLQQSVKYVNERVQFGRSIGKFQAIQQSLAVLACEVTAARTAVESACAAGNRFPTRFDSAVAKIRAGQAAGIGAAIAHQVHGALGFAYEYTLHFATRRLWSWRAEFGSESAWAQQLGDDAIRRGGDRFWEDLTGRSPVGDVL